MKLRPFQSINPQYRGRIRRAYESLSVEQREEALERYKRHLRACEKSQCQPEIMFLIEAIEELAAGRPLEAEEVRGEL